MCDIVTLVDFRLLRNHFYNNNINSQPIVTSLTLPFSRSPLSVETLYLYIYISTYKLKYCNNNFLLVARYICCLPKAYETSDGGVGGGGRESGARNKLYVAEMGEKEKIVELSMWETPPGSESRHNLCQCTTRYPGHSRPSLTKMIVS